MNYDEVALKMAATSKPCINEYNNQTTHQQDFKKKKRKRKHECVGLIN